jgi:putative ABC transport system substrate-binding protein
MVLAITTDAAQTIAGKTTEIPILGTAITSYTVAGLIDSDEKPGGNITGTSDMNPVAAQVDLIRELAPDAAVIGLIYNSSEDNSVLQADLAKKQIEASGLKWEEATVTNSNEIQQAMQSLATKCGAIYIPTDNTVASAMATVNSVASEAKIPTICGESSMVMEGGLATMGINYYDLGYKTGLMAIEVINGKNPGDMPIQYADKSDEVTINGLVAEEMGFTVPDKYIDAVVMPEVQ